MHHQGARCTAPVLSGLEGLVLRVLKGWVGGWLKRWTFQGCTIQARALASAGGAHGCVRAWGRGWLGAAGALAAWPSVRGRGQLLRRKAEGPLPR